MCPGTHIKAGRTRLGQFCSQVLLCFSLGAGQEGQAPSHGCSVALAQTQRQLEALGNWPSPPHPKLSPEWVAEFQALNEVMIIPDGSVWVDLHFGCVWPSHCLYVCVCACVCVECKCQCGIRGGDGIATHTMSLAGERLSLFWVVLPLCPALTSHWCPLHPQGGLHTKSVTSAFNQLLQPYSELALRLVRLGA